MAQVDMSKIPQLNEHSSLQEAQEMIVQTMIQSLMANQGMDYTQAEDYARKQVQATTGYSGSAGPAADVLQAQENPGMPITPPTMPQVEQTAPQVAAKPPSVAPAPTPAEQQAQSSPSPEPAPGSAPPSILDNPEAVDAVLGMGGRNREMDYAEGMRSMDQPGGRYVSGGRVYVASNPLEHIAPVVGKYKGTKMIKGLEKEQTAAKKALIDALREKKEDEEDIEEAVAGSPGYRGAPI